jgi:preprotein translocase subunit SecF
MKEFNIIGNKNKFFIFSGILMILSIISLSIWGLDLGIDFVGGSILEVETSQNVMIETQDMTDFIQNGMGEEIGETRVQPTESGYLIRMKELSENEHQKLLQVVDERVRQDLPEGEEFSSQEKRFESIGPVIGNELKTKSIWALLVSLAAIVLFVAWAFRHVSRPVASWKYGLAAIAALVHDILIVVGIFAVLGHFLLGYEVGVFFVTALLTILGYSVNDTIVVFDRVRENLIFRPQKTFAETVNKSLNETLLRSINTSVTTLLVLSALYIFGGTTIQSFVLAMMIGVVAGAYSSIFIASPLLVVWFKLGRKK